MSLTRSIKISARSIIALQAADIYTNLNTFIKIFLYFDVFQTYSMGSNSPLTPPPRLSVQKNGYKKKMFFFP